MSDREAGTAQTYWCGLCAADHTTTEHHEVEWDDRDATYPPDSSTHPLTRPSTVFERPADNVYRVPDGLLDGVGTPPTGTEFAPGKSSC